MPIRVPDGLPAAETLRAEGVKVMRESRAARQDIRPLRIAILNLMPLKIATETVWVVRKKSFSVSSSHQSNLLFQHLAIVLDLHRNETVIQ